ncbi:diguanylate cyclase (GGDEF)-like protein [Clostridium tetanomorphum]|uniref:GGDEF domain-containing protein n=1 Tax=Clostridium tetanomorphum TaxID=1553 RepID=A0A923E5N9_CLOTT|nr:GGDEF domain-containing protein [Clostridium tetanomorphum]KAJ52622.1 diguanylate cyclase/phosphodiesterase [Clostridium tetanomorphum DSM 665]MBC2396823.1 GGDEF domain-containing protein [Clostridium tetanomorphum]MBP1863215.1 diguanylate cyclase (GGDEF)-like protein [Clostridium tetanomorphum]NRS84323.1 diguanylate cyclase (GGDEF)-like protein [Clostridium tetanomorphum]NRZ97537.1 diguanylate cyclase (GGDEF)-like protein [Clostridium tetanomorphum]
MRYIDMTYEELLHELTKKDKKIKKLCRQIRRLELKASIDSMTGVLNRGFGLKKLKEAMKYSTLNRHNLVICFIDIDKLKNINDTFGHSEGDRLLKKVTEVIKECIRDYDFIFRVGGDEFILVFNNAKKYEIKAITNDINKKLEYINKKEEFKYSISISMGFAKFDFNKNMTLENLIKEADRQMYKNKINNWIREV